MKKILTILLVVFPAVSLFAAFDPQAYFDYLKQHKDMTYQQLLTEFPSGDFIKENHIDFKHFKYADTLTQKLSLNSNELGLINKYGFMVSQRHEYENFISAFYDIYQKDLPVYISADALLHAVHYSFNNILDFIESTYLKSLLGSILINMTQTIPQLEAKSNNSLYLRSLKDFDVYLTVPLNVEYSTVNHYQPYFSSNLTVCNDMLNKISLLQATSVKLFSENCRDYDFSQLTPRGHYTKYGLKEYFKMMMWLGRTELYIDAPNTTSLCFPSQDDIDRQLILIGIVADAVRKAGVLNDYNNFQNLLTFLCGTQNGCSVDDVLGVMDKLGIKDASELVNDQLRKSFQSELKALNSSKQLYQSQILSSDPYSLEQVSPAPVFLFIGQRPVIDGFIAANVVYDRIIYQGMKQARMLPNSLDVLFALGNDASIQLLAKELNNYNYSANLAGCRYLISSLDSAYWSSSYYSGWLNSIRSLNPPKDRSALPLFMQTGAWQQKNMTTQLASWAELRHDFILYAMQSYSASYDTCSNPDFFIEPVPELYKRLGSLAQYGYNMTNTKVWSEISEFFKNMKNTFDTLAIISDKLLLHQDLNENEIIFGKSVISSKWIMMGCTSENVFDGWYPRLFCSLPYGPDNIDRLNSAVIADIHTSPTDEMGNPVGWVKHIGTGKVNLAVIGTKNRNGEPMAFAGPVYSYYEVVTTNFKRLTDEEWLATFYQSNALRPPFTNLFTIDSTGVNSGEKIALPGDKVGVNDPQAEVKPELICYPNPFKTSCLIGIKVPQSYSGMNFDVQVTDINGNKVSGLLSEPIESGNYLLRWEPDGKLSSGMYFVRLSAGNSIITTKIEYVK